MSEKQADDGRPTLLNLGTTIGKFKKFELDKSKALILSSHAGRPMDKDILK